MSVCFFVLDFHPEVAFPPHLSGLHILEVIVCFYFLCYHNALWFCWNGAKLAYLCVRVMKGGKSRRAAASLMHFESGTQNRHETKRLGELASVQQPLMNRARRSFTLQTIELSVMANETGKDSFKRAWKNPCPELPEWCSPSQRETKHSATSESLLQFFPFQKEVKKAEKEGLLHCDQYALHMSDCSRCLSTRLMFLFLMEFGFSSTHLFV